MEPKHPDIVSSLFARSDTNARVEVLVPLVLDLFMEVEALREYMKQLEQGTRTAKVENHNHSLIQTCEESSYRKAYLDTAYMTHTRYGKPHGGRP